MNGLVSLKFRLWTLLDLKNKKDLEKRDVYQFSKISLILFLRVNFMAKK